MDAVTTLLPANAPNASDLVRPLGAEGVEAGKGVQARQQRRPRPRQPVVRDGPPGVAPQGLFNPLTDVTALWMVSKDWKDV